MACKGAKGKRAHSRRRMKKHGPKTTINKILEGFEKDEKVLIKIDPSIHSAQPPVKFSGYTGTVIGHRGKAFNVEFKNGNKSKQLIIASAHLYPVLKAGEKK